MPREGPRRRIARCAGPRCALGWFASPSPSPQGLCCSERLRTVEGAKPRGTAPQPSPQARLEGACGARISKSNRRIGSREMRRLTHQWRSTSYASAGDKGNRRPGPPFSSGGPQSPRGSGPRVERRDQPATKTEHQGDLCQGRLPDARCQSPRQEKQLEYQGPQSQALRAAACHPQPQRHGPR